MWLDLCLAPVPSNDLVPCWEVALSWRKKSIHSSGDPRGLLGAQSNSFTAMQLYTPAALRGGEV